MLYLLNPFQNSREASGRKIYGVGNHYRIEEHEVSKDTGSRIYTVLYEDSSDGLSA